MTTDDRIVRHAEYWCYHKPRREEMADEMRQEMRKLAQEAFAAGMAFQQDCNVEFDGFWETILKTEITY